MRQCQCLSQLLPLLSSLYCNTSSSCTLLRRLPSRHGYAAVIQRTFQRLFVCPCVGRVIIQNDTVSLVLFTGKILRGTGGKRTDGHGRARTGTTDTNITPHPPTKTGSQITAVAPTGTTAMAARGRRAARGRGDEVDLGVVSFSTRIHSLHRNV